MKKITTSLVLILFITCVYSQSPTLDIDLLKFQISTLNEINNRLLNTVYWTIGTFAVIISAIFALNLFLNLRANKREFENYKDENKNTFRNEFDRYKEESNKTILGAIEKIASDNEKNLNKKIEEIEKEKIAPLKASLSILDGKCKQLKRDFIESNINMESPDKVSIWSLVKLLEMDIEKGWDYLINETLDKIYTSIKNQTISSSTASELMTQLKKLDESYAKNVERINKTIKITE